jgi:catechol 2,3-dioxygenase-like lactoylglutathione lyase family enzyme
MISSIDHAVILVSELARASEDYSVLGFTVTPGGEHADGLTHNALIPFADGSYLELIAFKGDAPESHPFYRDQGFEGLVTFALLPTDIASDVEAARQRGLEIDGPRPGGRVRPDGQRVEWQTARAHTPDLPFLCGDVTPRELRVPGGEAREHMNGVTGVSGITVVVDDLQASTNRYRQLLGTAPLTDLTVPELDLYTAAFQVGAAVITLVQASGPMRAVGPSELQLAMSRLEGEAFFDKASTHGAHFELAFRD